MKQLILVTRSDGHHLEYVEHLLQMSKLSTDTFVFCLHPGFKKFDSITNIKLTNVLIEYMSEQEVKLPSNRLMYSYKACRLLREKINMYEAEKVFLIMLMPFGPFIFAPIWGKVKISGILYSLYIYTWKHDSAIAKIYDSLRYWLMSKSKNIKSVFILNDEACARKLNMIYRTSKFKYLVDPYRPILNISAKYNLRENYPNKTIVSHLGFMKERKGSYDILRAIDELDIAVLKKYLFVFAGNSENPELFNELLKKAKEKSDILYFEGFLDFAELGELASSSDLLLLPYHNTNQSSGIIGYGAQFKVPVAVPNENLLGKLVRRYKLGIFLNGYLVNDIKMFLSEYVTTPMQKSSYTLNNNVTRFIEIINKYI